MKVLITGAGGQLGYELKRTCPSGVELVAVDVPELDVTDGAAVREFVSATRPAVIVNAAAYTAVDTAEQNEAAAQRVNADGAENLARSAREYGARLVHVSTDFVFAGTQSHPYAPGDVTGPLSAYGRSKLEGERRVLTTCGEHAVVVRTSWLYGIGGANFVKTMLRLMGQRDQVRVIADQVGTPTWAFGLAELIWRIAPREQSPSILHWSDAGAASWYDFAVAIAEEGRAAGLLTRETQVLPIPTTEYPTPAVRPKYSVLDKQLTWQTLGLTGVHWRVQLRRMLQELRELPS